MRDTLNEIFKAQYEAQIKVIKFKDPMVLKHYEKREQQAKCIREMLLKEAKIKRANIFNSNMKYYAKKAELIKCFI